MNFEIKVVSSAPLTSLDDFDEAAIRFLDMIGYLPNRIDPKSGATDVKSSIPYRLFLQLVERPERVWTVDEMTAVLDTTKPTVYRHINKLKCIDIIEDVVVETEEGTTKRGYRIRYGNLSKAWNFVEAHAEMALESYRVSVDHLQKLLDKK
jgi:predicted transcriptional regulator